jgi:aryl-alcohol dehydrogenase-like predicted oxidoreductase
MHLSVEASLKKLRTSYIDIFYLHWWDFDTSVEEVVNGMHILVQQGKVLYLVTRINSCDIIELLKFAVSGYLRHTCLDCVQGQSYARDQGKTPFAIYQGMWNILERSFERDIIPMARAEGTAAASWG